MTDDEDNLCVRSHEVPIPPIAVSATGARIAFANRLLVIGMGHPHAAPQKIQSSLVKRYPLHAGKKYHVLSTLLRRLRTYEVYVLQKVGKRSARHYWTKKSPLRTSLSRTFSAVLSHNTRRTIGWRKYCGRWCCCAPGKCLSTWPQGVHGTEQAWITQGPTR